MLLTVVSLTFLVVPCASHTGLLGPIPGISSPPQCRRNDSIDKQSIVRQTLFNYFNNLRHHFAEGEDMFPNVTHQKIPRSMYGMRYDCLLEQKAFKALQARETRLNDFECVLLNYDKSVDPKLDVTAHLLAALDYWGTTNGEAQATLMFPYVLFFGCAHSYTEERETHRLRLTCVFEKKITGFVQEGHGPCKVNDDCKRFKNTECKDSLCWVQQRSFTPQ